MAEASEAKALVPHNFGDKVKKLRAAFEPDQPGANAKLAKALDGFADHLSRRNLLVHSISKVAIDAKGQWVWRYCFRPSGKGCSIESGAFEKAHAHALERSLARASQSLVGKLRTVRGKLEAVTK
jgi:hypothetical protein